MQRRLVSPILFTVLQDIGQVDLCAQPNGVRILKLSPYIQTFSSFRTTAAICGTEIALYGFMKRNIVEYEPTSKLQHKSGNGCLHLTGDTDDAVH